MWPYIMTPFKQGNNSPHSNDITAGRAITCSCHSIRGKYSICLSKCQFVLWAIMLIRRFRASYVCFFSSEKWKRKCRFLLCFKILCYLSKSHRVYNTEQISLYQLCCIIWVVCSYININQLQGSGRLHFIPDVQPCSWHNPTLTIINT